MKYSPREDLLKLMLGYMLSENSSTDWYLKYARRIKSQIELIQEIENRKISKDDWLNMAIELGRTALVKDIGAKRIAKSIYPLVDGSGQSSNIASISPVVATHILLSICSAHEKLTETEKKFLVKIVEELQNLHPKNH
ncbi:MAG: hypothetical protein CL666_13755 [Balneola sp.]|nr:hypothetical protein [Balneola sp.]|tara:strand:- start:284 stop:697 length:414 start_codon:yes stop_codon:yes gene_type:complete